MLSCIFFPVFINLVLVLLGYEYFPVFINLVLLFFIMSYLFMIHIYILIYLLLCLSIIYNQLNKCCIFNWALYLGVLYCTFPYKVNTLYLILVLYTIYCINIVLIATKFPEFNQMNNGVSFLC